jgi:Flp pilus assembly protein TadG
MQLSRSRSRPANPSSRAVVHGSRRGIAGLWVLVAVPALVGVLLFIIDVAVIWQAQGEAQTAVEAAALAAVREYAQNNVTYDADTRDAAVAYAAANTAGVGQPVLPAVFVDRNNGNAASGDVVLGQITGAGPFTFDSNAPPINPVCNGGPRLAVMVRTEHQVNSLILSTFLGQPVGTYYVQARAVAQFDCTAGTPRLVQVTAYDPPF